MDASLLLNVITTVAVVVGVVVGLIELRQALNARRDTAAVDILRSVLTQEIRQAAGRILSLPDDVDADTIRADPSLLAAARAIDSACEMFGSIVYEGIAPLHLVDRMVGGWVRGSWTRLRRWENAERADTHNPSIAEWYEWLYDMLMANPDPGKAAGAQVFYRGRLRG